MTGNISRTWFTFPVRSTCNRRLIVGPQIPEYILTKQNNPREIGKKFTLFQPKKNKPPNHSRKLQCKNRPKAIIPVVYTLQPRIENPQLIRLHKTINQPGIATQIHKYLHNRSNCTFFFETRRLSHLSSVIEHDMNDSQMRHTNISIVYVSIHYNRDYAGLWPERLADRYIECRSNVSGKNTKIFTLIQL